MMTVRGSASGADRLSNGTVVVRDSVEAAVLATLPTQESLEFAELVASARSQDPDLDPEVIRAEIWALLARGDLRLTKEQRVERR